MNPTQFEALLEMFDAVRLAIINDHQASMAKRDAAFALLRAEKEFVAHYKYG